MAINQPRNNFEALAQRDGLHILPGSEQTVTVDGVQWTEETYVDRNEELSTPARIFRGLAGVIAFPINAWKRGREWGLGSAIDGRIERKVRHTRQDPLDRERRLPAANLNSPAMQQHIQDMIVLGAPHNYQPSALIERLGYDPKNRMSIQAYLERPEIKSRMIKDDSTGNYMLPENHREGVTSFLFVPKGDFTKASSVILSDGKTGFALVGHQFEKAMNTYQAQYEGTLKDKEEQVKHLTTQLAKKYEQQGIEREPQELRQEVLNEMRVAVLDHKRKNTRFFSHINPNYRNIYTNPFKGTRSDWDKATVEYTDEIQRTKPSDHLPNNRPFAHLANQGQNQNLQQPPVFYPNQQYPQFPNPPQFPPQQMNPNLNEDHHLDNVDPNLFHEDN